MDKILKHERVKERKNEWTNERTNEYEKAISLMFLCEKTTKYKEKVWGKCAKTAISGIFPAFTAGKKLFSKIRLGHVLSIPNAHLHGKNQKKQMMKSREKRFFRHIFGIFDRKWIFSGNRAPSHFGHYDFASLCQKSGNTNEPISRKAGNERTDKG